MSAERDFREIAVYKAKPDGWIIESPYNEDFVTELKDEVPREHRRWEPVAKVWCIGAGYDEVIAALLCKHYGFDWDGFCTVRCTRYRDPYTMVNTEQAAYYQEIKDTYTAELEKANGSRGRRGLVKAYLEILASRDYRYRNRRKARPKKQYTSHAQAEIDECELVFDQEFYSPPPSVQREKATSLEPAPKKSFWRRLFGIDSRAV